jgi:putative acetyltransferase
MGGMEFVIRGVRDQDREAVHAIITSPHVVAGSMRVPYAPLQQTADRLEPRPGLHQLVAEAAGQVIGFAELVTHPTEPRGKHAGDINLVATHADHGGKGVGRALVAALVDVSDRWLNLNRLGLIVFTGNEHARRLYESFGFEHEGTLRRFAYGDGCWMDAHAMARLKD